MEVSCSFNNNFPDDQCWIRSCRIPKNIDIKLTGCTYDRYGNNRDLCVNEIHLIDCDLEEVPRGLGKRFPYLNSLTIKNSKLKSITKNDLTEFKTFNKIDFSSNEIDFLPGDLFEGFENLKTIIFNENKLSVVEPNILDGLDKLKCVSLPGYGSFNVNFAVRHFDREMMEVKKSLIEKFCSNIQSSSEFILNLQSNFQMSKKTNLELTKEIEELNKKLEISEKSNENLKTVETELNQKLEDKENVIENLTQQVEKLELELKGTEQKNLLINESNAKLQSELEQEKLKNDQNLHERQCSLFKDLKTFIQDETKKDFRIIIEGREFPLHKFLLAARSPTLAEILKNNPEVENLNLVDISVEIFEIILKFLYTDELPVSNTTNFLHLFAAAGKLKIQELKEYAASKLLNMMDAENVLEIFNISTKYEHYELKIKAFNQIRAKYPKVDIKDEWITDGENIEKLIKFFKKMEEAEKSLEHFMM